MQIFRVFMMIATVMVGTWNFILASDGHSWINFGCGILMVILFIRNFVEFIFDD